MILFIRHKWESEYGTDIGLDKEDYDSNQRTTMPDVKNIAKWLSMI